MIQGSIVALITPFLENEELDIESFKKLIHWQIEQGTKGLVIGGTTGESPTLSTLELELLISIAVKEAKGRIPIIAGVGSNNTKETVEKTLRAKELGADGCIAIFPYYNRPGFQGCLAHFKAISDCNLPLVVYYHPGRTSIHLSVLELSEICSLKSVVALKDCSGNPSQALEVMKLSKKTLLSGDDSLALPFLEGGAEGMISVLGNLFPEQWSLMIEAALSKDIEKAKVIYKGLAPLCEAIGLETNPQCIKYAMSLMGHCLPILRLPLMLPRKEVASRIEQEMALLKIPELISQSF